ncbi:MAG: hypothetical protein AAF715_18290 [Myxococcota bacterium]
MADRVDFYLGQRVTETELDLACELLEQADRDLASDIGIYGIVTGAVPTQHSPVPDLTVDLTSPTRAYDRLGQFAPGEDAAFVRDLVHGLLQREGTRP